MKNKHKGAEKKEGPKQKQDNGKPGKELEKSGEDIDILNKEIEDLKKESGKNYDLYLRKTAEFENYKKRSCKERESIEKYSNEKLLKSILPVLDNLNRAICSAKEAKNLESLIDGVEMTRDQFLATLKSSGIEEIDSKGALFDPSLHEAIRLIDSCDHPENTIIEEYEKGYILNNRVIRPSKVSVTTKKEQDNEAPDAVEDVGEIAEKQGG